MSETTTAIKLNIGAGGSDLPGFIPVDIKQGIDASGKLPYDDNSVAEIYSSHCLEHIHHSLHIQTLREWVRVLKPGGRIRIAVPDFDMIFQQYLAGEISPDKLNCWIHGTNPEETDRHKIATFNHDRLSLLMRRVGIDQIEPFEAEFKDCSTLSESINLQGVKRAMRGTKEAPRVCMVMSRPRVGFMDCADRICETARQLGWPHVSAEGTEWGRGLTQGIESAIRSTDCDYIFTLDYDSVFDPEDAKELLRLMQENPDVGAIYPVQMHRHRSGVLGSMDGEDYSGELTPTMSGHFGCTIIRREVFDVLPQPWFMSLPNPVTGRWLGGGSTLDADIYFWVQLWDHGFKACMANRVMIGHMELCVKWGVKNGEFWQTLRDYRDKGRPASAMFDGAFWKQASAKTSKMVPQDAQQITAEDAQKGYKATDTGTITIKSEPFETIEGHPRSHIPVPNGMHPPHAAGV